MVAVQTNVSMTELFGCRSADPAEPGPPHTLQPESDGEMRKASAVGHVITHFSCVLGSGFLPDMFTSEVKKIYHEA